MSLLYGHRWAIFLAVCAGLIFAAPQQIFQLALGDDFKGVFRVVSGDETYYMVRAREVVDGHPTLSNPYFLEHKQGLPMQFYLPDVMAAYPARLLNIDVYELYAVYDFILIIVHYLLFYAIMCAVTKERFWSNIFASWFFFVQYLFLFNRPVSPQVNFLFVELLTLLVIRLVSGSGRKKGLVISLGIIFGILFHAYTYYWTFFALVFALLAVAFLLRKQIREAASIGGVMLIGFIVGLPYLYQTYLASQQPHFVESLERLGLLSTRFPSGVQVVLPATMLLFGYILYFKFVRKRRQDYTSVELFIIAALLACVIAVNQHVVTGQNLLFSSHYEPVAIFIVTIACAYLVMHARAVSAVLHQKVVKFMAPVLIFALFFPQFRTESQFSYEDYNRQRYRAVFDWLNAHTQAEDVVMAPRGLRNSIPAYTHNNVLYAEEGVLFFVPQTEIFERFIANDYWLEFDDTFIKDRFFAVYGIQYLARRGRERQKNIMRRFFGIPEKNLNEVLHPLNKMREIREARSEINETEWQGLLGHYSVRYVIVDEREGARLLPNHAITADFQRVYDQGEFSIYRVGEPVDKLL